MLTCRFFSFFFSSIKKKTLQKVVFLCVINITKSLKSLKKTLGGAICIIINLQWRTKIAIHFKKCEFTLRMINTQSK